MDHIITATHNQMPAVEAPTLDNILNTKQAIAPWVLQTPMWQLKTNGIDEIVGNHGELHYKIECWQHTGTFKARGAVASVKLLDEEQLKRGITAISAGNHAIAVSYAAHCFNTHAKVLMPKTASPVRIEQCKNYGADVIFTDNMHELFDAVAQIQAQEQRALIHPYNGLGVALGTGSLGAELCQQLDNIDAVIVAVGGGGLIAGMACAIKQMQPKCTVYGVEPYGANTMSESFKQGKPVKAEQLNTIADSLSAPHCEHYSYDLCRQFVDGLVNVDDNEIRDAMRWLFGRFKFAVEPAAAVATAGLLGPLRDTVKNQRIAVILCGSNIDLDRYYQLLKQ